MSTGIILVDRGSRNPDSNQVVEEVAALLRRRLKGRFRAVEPAHMEHADPCIADAYRRCVERGVCEIVVVPFFLAPGRHWHYDIPRLVAASHHIYPFTHYRIAAPLGIDELILQLVEKRAEESLQSDVTVPMLSLQ